MWMVSIIYIIMSFSFYIKKPWLLYILGAHFGTTFPHLFVETFSDDIKLKPSKAYVGRLFGFRISEQSVTGPRMQWLRMIPANSSTSASS